MTDDLAGWAFEQPLRIFIVAGEHSGDALGGRLMAALHELHGGEIRWAGVGGELMEAQGLASLFPMSDVAVMGPGAILRRLGPIVRRVYRTIDAALAFEPDVVVIIDAPELTHAIARRIRRRRPAIPIVDYVSPTVWAWRPGRAKAMRPYVDHLLALLPFEPAAHARLGGPPCTYVGHPLIERMESIWDVDPMPLARRLGLDLQRPVLVLLPGSRRSEVGRLLETFRETVAVLATGPEETRPEVILPVVSTVRGMIEESLPRWAIRPHLVTGEDDKWAAFRLARAALAASGTVTLELAVAGTPMVIAYKVERWAAPLLRRMIKVELAGLPNLILGEMVFPELIQEACTPAALARALAETMAEGPARERQLAGLAEVPRRLAVPHRSPSEAAARIVLDMAGRRVSGEGGA
jgi:lipid-A-disaccharide synthase